MSALDALVTGWALFAWLMLLIVFVMAAYALGTMREYERWRTRQHARRHAFDRSALRENRRIA